MFSVVSSFFSWLPSTPMQGTYSQICVLPQLHGQPNIISNDTYERHNDKLSPSVDEGKGNRGGQIMGKENTWIKVLQDDNQVRVTGDMEAKRHGGLTLWISRKAPSFFDAHSSRLEWLKFTITMAALPERTQTRGPLHSLKPHSLEVRAMTHKVWIIVIRGHMPWKQYRIPFLDCNDPE